MAVNLSEMRGCRATMYVAAPFRTSMPSASAIASVGNDRAWVCSACMQVQGTVRAESMFSKGLDSAEEEIQAKEESRAFHLLPGCSCVGEIYIQSDPSYEHNLIEDRL